MGPSIAVLAMALACLSSPAQNNSPIPNEPWYFPIPPEWSSQPRPKKPPQQDNTATPTLKKRPAKQDNTAAPASAPTLQDAETLQLEIASIISEPKFQPDPDSGLMKLDVVVTDHQGKSIAGLGEKDLTLLDNGQPRNIVTFQAFDGAASKPGSPVEIILVIDEVDLPAVLLGSVEQPAQKFLLQNGGHLAQPVKIYRIGNDGLFASAQPTTDGNALAKEIVERAET
jgi:hypothetical protein